VIFLPIPELIVVDLKFGMGLEVFPEANSQAMMYAAGVLEKHQLWDEVKQIRIVIAQPRLLTGDTVKEWLCSTPVLRAFADKVRATSKQIAILVGGAAYLGGKNKNVIRDVPMIETYLTPSEKACKFCPASAFCPALTTEVDRALAVDPTAGFVDETGEDPTEVGRLREQGVTLGLAMDKTGLLEVWLHAVRAQVERELLANRKVLGRDGYYKLVRGRKGDRKWEDAAKIESLFKETIKLTPEEMYKRALITPSAAEKLFKKASWWAEVDMTSEITQAEGALSVASALDKRPEVVQEPATTGFKDEDCSDLI